MIHSPLGCLRPATARRTSAARRSRSLVRFFAVTALVSLFAGAAIAQDLSSREHMTTLSNGMRIVLVEQHAAPVVSFVLMFDVGGLDEPPGLGGIAHMVEHMAFKGTTTIGSHDATAEAAALTDVEIWALALKRARATGDEAALAAFQQGFERATQRAGALASSNPLDDLLSVNGATGLNASTGYDATQYVVSLPSNRIELYARIYADVMANAVFRSFYAERDVVREERRQRSEDDPQGVLFEAFLTAGFPGEPYGRPLIGEAAAIAGYTATNAHAFYNAFYAPDRAVLVMVGDVDPVADLAVLERYFGAVPRRTTVHTLLPRPEPQSSERRVAVTFDAQPQLMVGWRKPTYPDRDAYVFDLIDALLSGGRTSRLYQRMVLNDQIALDIATSSGFPGVREPNAFIVYGLPRAPYGTDDLEAALDDEIDRLVRAGVSDSELQKVKNQVRAATIRGLASNAGLASSLAYNELFGGGWENLIADLDVYDSITTEEVQSAAARVFRPENRTVAVLLPPEEAR